MSHIADKGEIFLHGILQNYHIAFLDVWTGDECACQIIEECLKFVFIDSARQADIFCPHRVQYLFIIRLSLIACWCKIIVVATYVAKSVLFVHVLNVLIFCKVTKLYPKYYTRRCNLGNFIFFRRQTSPLPVLAGAISLLPSSLMHKEDRCLFFHCL